MTYLKAVCGALAFLALSGAPALAKDIPAGGFTSAELVKWLQDKGYAATVEKHDDGDTIETSGEGKKFYLDMYDCKAGRCASIQFVSGYDLTSPMTAEKVNEWNTKKRYVRAQLDDEGDPYLRYDVNVSPGGTFESWEDEFDTWLDFLPVFATFVGW